MAEISSRSNFLKILFDFLLNKSFYLILIIKKKKIIIINFNNSLILESSNISGFTPPKEEVRKFF